MQFYRTLQLTILGFVLVQSNDISALALTDQELDTLTTNITNHIQRQITPSGMITLYSGTTAPNGWMFCDGRSLSSAEYHDLYQAIGNTYGGDRDHFNIPDTRGLFVRGAGSQVVAGITYQGNLGSKSPDTIQGHYHEINDPGHNHTQNPHHHGPPKGMTGLWFYGSGGNTIHGGGGSGGAMATGDIMATNNSATTGISVSGPSNDGSNGAPRISQETKPANISINYIIKI